MIISIVNRSETLSDSDLLQAIRAINRQIDEDFEPYWSFSAILRLEGSIGQETKVTLTEMRGDAIIYIQDEADVNGALGYHDTHYSGIPYGFVFKNLCDELGENWTVTLSHEALELLADAQGNLLVRGPHPDSSKLHEVFHWFEMCDAVQTQTYIIDSIEVSNFVLPLYFTVNDQLGGRNDFLGKKLPNGSALSSFGVADGGYIGFYNPKTGESEIYSAGDERANKRIEIKNKNKSGRGFVRMNSKLIAKKEVEHSAVLEKTSRKVHPVSYYSGRLGYNENFLSKAIPLPSIRDAVRFGSPSKIINSNEFVLQYEHFSIVQNANRKMAFFTAVNINGSESVSCDRDDVWWYDGRISIDDQIGNDLYGNEPSNFFDRGHLVRRLDPVWGEVASATRANSDSFHWTNCTPQYWEFNQKQTLWQGLENFILENTDNDNFKASVFTGPVFDESDIEHRGIKIPQKFWKVVVVEDQAGKLYASAYIVSQEKYVKDIDFARLPVGEFNNFQVSIKYLESLIGLSFGSVIGDADVLSGGNSIIPVKSLSELKLYPTSKFGRLDSFGAFIKICTEGKHIVLERNSEEHSHEFERRMQDLLARRERDVVEIEASVVEYKGLDSSGGDNHQHIIITVTKIINDDKDVASDLIRVQSNNEKVFLSIRFGDQMGLKKPLQNISPSTTLRLKGEWITKEKAYSHGGEKMSVIHFTHHPLGFVCVNNNECLS